MKSDRKLFSILFADIMGYTAMMHTDEIHALKVLDRFKTKITELIPAHNGHIWQFYGDGCLATFENGSDAVTCSMRLQESFREEPAVEVRIGLHLGEAVVSGENIHGDHVNIASRIESMSVPRGILMSRVMADQVKNKPVFVLKSMGQFDFKNINEPIEVFALANDGFPVPEPRALHGKFDEQKMRRRRMKKIVTFAAPILLILLLAVIWVIRGQRGEPIVVDNKTTLAVFPFQDLSSDGLYREYAILVRRAIHENLSRIGQIRLLSLSGISNEVDKFPSNQEIALKVDIDRYISGNILGLEDQTRTVQSELVEPKLHEAVWVNSFNQAEGQDIFSVVNPITEKILEEIGVEMPSVNQKKIKRVPTKITKAYSNVRKAINLTELRDEQSLAESVVLLQEAIELDGNYAEAYAELGNALFAQGWRNFVNKDSAYSEAEILSKKAIALYDQVKTANSVLATFAEVVEGDKEKARELYKRAIEVVPNDPAAHRHFSTFLKRNREYKEALEFAQTAAELSPLNVIINRNYIDLLINNKFLDQAQSHMDGLSRRIPEKMSRFVDLQGDILSIRGKYAEAVPFFEERLIVSKSVSGQLGYCYAQLGQMDKAKEMIALVPRTTYEYVNKAMIYAGMSAKDQSYEDSLFSYIDLVIANDKGVNFLCDHPFFDPIPIPVCEE